MTCGSSRFDGRRSAWDGLVGCAFALAVLGGCAEGAKIGDPFQDGSDDDDGDGGSRGDGGRRNDGGSRGDGGDPSSGDGPGPGSGPTGPTTSNVASSSASTSASSTSTSASSSASSNASSSASSSSAQSAAASTASSSAAQSTAASTGGGPLECNAPLDPAADCGAGQHCFPANLGVQPICSDAGNGGQYVGCSDATQCGPIFGCVEVVEDELPCCLQFCTNDFDCPNFDDLCYFFNPPQYAGGVQYGVCYDGAPLGCG